MKNQNQKAQKPTVTNDSKWLIVKDLFHDYTEKTPHRLKLIDFYLLYILLTGALQFLYCSFVGTYPFNAFLSGFLSCVGSFIFGVCLRMHTDPANKELFSDFCPERAFGEFIVAHLSNRNELNSIYKLARSGSKNYLKIALHQGPSLYQDLRVKHPLHEASAAQNHEAIEAILEIYPTHVNALKNGDWTPLMCLAASKNNGQKEKILLCYDILKKYKAQTNLLNKDGWNCLMLAVKHNNIILASALISDFPNLVKNIAINGRNVLHILCLNADDSKESIHLIKNILRADSFLIGLKDSCGCSPILECFKSGNLEIAKFLCDKDFSDILQITDAYGKNALHLSAESGKIESFEFLWYSAIDVKNFYYTCNGQTFLHLAAKEGHTNIIEFITVNLEEDDYKLAWANDKFGRSAIYYAALGTPGQPEVHRERRCDCIEIIINFIKKVNPTYNFQELRELASNIVKSEIIKKFLINKIKENKV